MKTSILSVLFRIALVCFAVVQNTQAVSPAPDGGYSGGNTAEGQNSLLSLTSGSYNTGVGIYSLLSLTDGNFCTGIGAGTLLANTADQNTATGAGALLCNTTGFDNMANGAFALFSNTTGASNTAIGSQALFSNTEGGLNTADGRRGLFMNITGSRNTATGFGALSSNTEGDDNTAIGVNALLFNVSGDNNAALGRSAGSDINVSGNVCIGQGVSGEAGVDDSTYIRNVNTTEQSPAEDVAYVTVRLSDGRLGHQPTVMRSASSELQKTAEELKSTVAREEATIAQLKNAMEVLTAQFKEHVESNPKVSAQVEMSKPVAQTVLNNQ